MDNIQLRVGDLIYALKKRWKFVAVLTFIGLIAGILLSGVSYLQGTMTRNYQIRASAVFVTETPSGKYAMSDEAPAYDDYRMARDMADTVKYILRSDRLYNKVIEKTGLLGISAGDISSNLQISVRTDTPVIEFALTWRSADEGSMILQSVLDTSTEVIREVIDMGRLSIIDAPSARYIVGGGINVPTWGLTIAFGFMVGVAFIVLELLLRPTMINLKDIQTQLGLETLGVIDKNDKEFASSETLLSGERLRSEIGRQYAAATYILRNRLGTKNFPKIFYVTSTGRGEGKTTVAANLAVQLADMEHKVLLVDFDSRNPSLGALMLKNVDMEHSLNALYRGEINEKEAITKLSGFLDILPVVLEHHPVPIDSTVIELIQRLSENYDYVIMDTPAVADSAEMLSLNQVAQDALFVVGYDMETKSAIREAVETLDKSGIRIVGCIVNQDKSVDKKMIFEREPKETGKPKNRKKRIAAEEAAANIDEADSTAERLTSRRKRGENQKSDTSGKSEAKPSEQQEKIKRNILEELSGVAKAEKMSDEEVTQALIEIALTTPSEEEDEKP